MTTLPYSRPQNELRRQLGARRRTYLALVSSIESQLRDLFSARAARDGFTQTALAERLGVNRSVISRRLSGASNMTIETLADMAWGVGGCVKVEIFDPADRTSSNNMLAQDIVLEWEESSRVPAKVTLNSPPKMWAMEASA
ncbi:MAG: helix-turn-helix domain-containing protein [Brevundimonas sp.]